MKKIGLFGLTALLQKEYVSLMTVSRYSHDSLKLERGICGSTGNIWKLNMERMVYIDLGTITLEIQGSQK